MFAGIFFASDVLGPVIAYICGGFLLELYTHFDTIDVSTSVTLTLHYITIFKVAQGLSIVPWEGAPAARGARSTAKFYHAVLNVTLTTKKGRQLFGRRKVHPREKILGTRMSVWYAPPRMVNPALRWPE